MKNLKIDGERLWKSLEDMAKVGATDNGGVRRIALTDVDKAGRDLFVSWCKAEGCSIEIDSMGNIFARRPGRNPALPPIMTGSHLDTQPTGGRFDGVYGVLAGLEVIRTLNGHGYETEAAIELAVWTNEEGCRFPPAMVGSGVFARVFDLEYGHSRKDMDGVELGSELERIGYAGRGRPGDRALGAYYEAHIEQGPVLIDEGARIGIVTGAQGQRWYELRLTGQEAHAGPTPMRLRRDALVGAARIVLEVNRIGHAFAPGACATVGVLDVSPGSRNTIPGNVFMTVDFRHPDDARLAEMDEALRQFVATIADELGLGADLSEIWHSPAVRFDPTCVDMVRKAATALDAPSLEIVSGAGHDACYISRIAPTAMIFIPCEEGISHNEAENISKEDSALGAQALLAVMVGHAELEEAEGGRG